MDHFMCPRNMGVINNSNGEEDIIQALGGLPENKKHCSNLGVLALRMAIDDYYKRKI